KNFAIDLDKACSAAFLIDADEPMRIALDDLNDLAGLTQQAALAAGFATTQSHPHHITIRRIHRRPGGDVNISASISALRALGPHKTKSLRRPPKRADQDVLIFTSRQRTSSDFRPLTSDLCIRTFDLRLSTFDHRLLRRPHQVSRPVT